MKSLTWLSFPAHWSWIISGADPSAGQEIGTCGVAVRNQPATDDRAVLGTGGLHGFAGQPPAPPAHHKNSKFGSLLDVKVPVTGAAGTKSKELLVTLVA